MIMNLFQEHHPTKRSMNFNSSVTILSIFNHVCREQGKQELLQGHEDKHTILTA